MSVERIETGIDGFDELIEGGFPRKSCILLSGMPGTGKTIFGLQYLCHGARNGEKGLYVTFEQNMDDLISNVGAFEWGIPALMDTGNLELLSMDIGEFKIDELVKKVKEEGHKRIVLDSLSTILSHPKILEEIDTSYMFVDKLDRMIPTITDISIATRFIVYNTVKKIKSLDCTTLITSELLMDSKSLSRDTISEFLADGVITLQYIMSGIDTGRNLMIRKLRSTTHSENIHPIEFRKGAGFSVLTP